MTSVHPGLTATIGQRTENQANSAGHTRPELLQAALIRHSGAGKLPGLSTDFAPFLLGVASSLSIMRPKVLST